MTSDAENNKTNEFLRRRKLRLQQVREQSKDIAKNIRLRAKSETLRQVVNLDEKKQKEYFDRQEKLVKRLEELYAKGLNKVGASHQSASELIHQGVNSKTDISKLRGKEAAVVLRKQRQDILDEKKKLLDRKLRAREAANELSREKSSIVANKLLPKASEVNDLSDTGQKTTEVVQEYEKDVENNRGETKLVAKNDIGTQCDVETKSNDEEPIIPAPLMSENDQGKLIDIEELKTNIPERSNRLDLFALSKEMPSDLRAREVDVPEVRDRIRPSLTLVTEYLQNRKLRLRETEATHIANKHPDDTSGLKQTILRSRSSKPEVPSKTSLNINNTKENVLNKKGSVVMYNHSTRDTKDIPQGEEQLVVRDLLTKEDAYVQAIKEDSLVHDKDNHQKKVQDMRNKVAVTKQTVEKEYRDTMNFLNSLPKTTMTKVNKTAYMDDRRQQMQLDNLQHKMQHEYRKIEKECKKHHSCMKKRHNNSRSPPKQNKTDEDFNIKDYQYSWMPVPESDGNLAIHTIPNSAKEAKTDHTVKFSNVDSYHEYRSRHKHTPPTKDTTSNEECGNKKRVETIIIDKNNSTDESSSTISESSSVEDLQLNKPSKAKPSSAFDQNLSDAERIIIYKILDTKSSKNCKKSAKLLSNIAKSLTSIEKVRKSATDNSHSEQSKKLNDRKEHLAKTTDDKVILEQINDGIYKLQKDKGDNMSSMYFNPETNKLQEFMPQTYKQTSKQKQLSETQKQDKGTFLEWQNGDNYEPVRTSKHHHGPATPKENETLVDQRSVTAGVATATPYVPPFNNGTKDQENSSTAEGGYIKLVDETGQEAGKLFLGGTDFLKENAYEVVIQLRKKDCLQQVTNEIPKQNTNKDIEVKSDGFIQNVINSKNNQQSTPANSKDCGIQEEGTAFKNVLENDTKIISSPKFKQLTHTTKKVQDMESQHSPGSETSIDIRLVKSYVDKDVTDKGTSIQYDLPSTEIDPPSRPATTTYTQTTDSPIHRPVYLHMSSSTSTAYMSPPEMILPHFLKSGFETNLPESLGNGGKRDIKNTKYPSKTLSKKNLIINDYDNNTQPDTPPNTARCVKHKHDCIDISQNKRKGSKSFKVEGTNKRKCKCRHCGIDTPYKNNFKRYFHRNVYTPTESHQQPQNYFFKNITTKNRHTRPGIKKYSMDSLNPIIRNYINKLLTLNREGLKALEVADQECSSIATPSSSVINVPFNFNDRKSCTQSNLSLEHIKKLLMQQVCREHLQKMIANNNNSCMDNTLKKNTSPRKYRRKVLHKVKSVNISKHLLKKRTRESKANKDTSPCTTTDDNNKFVTGSIGSKSEKQSLTSKKASSKKDYKSKTTTCKSDVNNMTACNKEKVLNSFEYEQNTPGIRKQKLTTLTDTSSELTKEYQDYFKTDIPINMSTQTCQNIDNNDYMKLAEDKLNNMEKIADLTDKCTKRLSSLAKVLEEVRKNKSLAYSQITGSDSAESQSDHTSDKVVQSPLPMANLDASHRLHSSETDQLQITSIEGFPSAINPNKTNLEEKKLIANEEVKAHPEYVSFLTDIPKPSMFKLPDSNVTSPEISHTMAASPLRTDSLINLPKFRAKPPPALSRMHLKGDQEHIIPHELSTVLEVDSPMSLKNKNQSSRIDIPNSSNKSSYDEEPGRANGKSDAIKGRKGSVNPDLLQLNREKTQQLKRSSHELLNDSKLQMIDLNHFNEIMLEPFVSIHEYAKKYNLPEPREGSNVEDKDHMVNDDISSLHSDGSLPDVIAELLKRNVITEPFKFDTASNINSTTMSSESTLSMLALSKARKSKKKSSVVFKDKENVGESTDSLSISSNPDLENALQKLGMGWASSTLKKTKERLALSSSSNTSSSSLSQFKIKGFNQDIPALVTDSVSSVLLSKKILQNKNLTDNSKSAKQQTSFTNSMTVKEFLANELANKITFTTNKTGINDTEEEFASLFVTKMPEALKQQSQTNRDEISNESIPSGANRARTSTPVQLFKSMTYHSSSCSNVSNGLFSNADDLSSVKITSNSMKNHSTSDKDDLTIPGLSLKIKKSSDCSKSD